jgi:hypothetical protein
MTTTGTATMESWIGLLTAPVVFLLNLQVSLAAVSHWTLHIAGSVSITATLGAGFLAWRNWRRPQNDDARQDQFMGYIGVLETCFFLIALVARWIPAAAAIGA